MSNKHAIGILPLIKPSGRSSFQMVSLLRKLTGVQKIGHAGTLDPFASGVMVMLIGKQYTRLSNQFLNHDKRYTATLFLGLTTDTFDCDGIPGISSSLIPREDKIDAALSAFQGSYAQIPPMFSAKKINGQRLYNLARKGVTVERTPVTVSLDITLLSYAYPYLTLDVRCSKGTYIRALAHDIGAHLGCGAHLSALTRTQSGPYNLGCCCDALLLMNPDYPWQTFLHDR